MRQALGVAQSRLAWQDEEVVARDASVLKAELRAQELERQVGGLRDESVGLEFTASLQREEILELQRENGEKQRSQLDSARAIARINSLEVALVSSTEQRAALELAVDLAAESEAQSCLVSGDMEDRLARSAQCLGNLEESLARQCVEIADQESDFQRRHSGLECKLAQAESALRLESCAAETRIAQRPPSPEPVARLLPIPARGAGEASSRASNSEVGGDERDLRQVAAKAAELEARHGALCVHEASLSQQLEHRVQELAEVSAERDFCRAELGERFGLQEPARGQAEVVVLQEALGHHAAAAGRAEADLTLVRAELERCIQEREELRAALHGEREQTLRLERSFAHEEQPRVRQLEQEVAGLRGMALASRQQIKCLEQELDQKEREVMVLEVTLRRLRGDSPSSGSDLTRGPLADFVIKPEDLCFGTPRRTATPPALSSTASTSRGWERITPPGLPHSTPPARQSEPHLGAERLQELQMHLDMARSAEDDRLLDPAARVSLLEQRLQDKEQQLQSKDEKMVRLLSVLHKHRTIALGDGPPEAGTPHGGAVSSPVGLRDMC